MVCFGVFCGAKFDILVATKSCKNHTLNSCGTRADVTKRNKHMLLSFFLTSPINTDQSTAVSLSVTCFRDRNPLRIRYCDILSQKQTQFFSSESELNSVRFFTTLFCLTENGNEKLKTQIFYCSLLHNPL